MAPSNQTPANPQDKRCFVTTGATASFAGLIRTVLTPEFLTVLHKHNYTSLRIQFGVDGQKTFDDYRWNLGTSTHGIEISGFEFDKSGLWREMVAAREGCVVSHAGSGSILDALRVGAPLLVVPNPELMDNHQVELAEVLESQNYVVHGRLEDLVQGLEQVEGLSVAMKQWPPVMGNGGKRGGLAKVVREEMGWLD